MAKMRSLADGVLRLDALPPLPQSQTIRGIAPRVWEDANVVALWLGGSFANGSADAYSDVDLRVAVPPADLAEWEAPDLAALLGAPPLAQAFVRFDPDSFLHHLILANGDILDLVVRSAEQTPSAEPILVLGCRVVAFARLLDENSHALQSASKSASADLVREIVVAFWVNSHKHRKVLYRDLDLMFPAASYANWQMLMRLWYIASADEDVRPDHFSGIHGLSELVRAVEGDFGTAPLALCGAPIRTRAEICLAIERYQDSASRLGRALAERYGFAYPAELEAMVRRKWQAFRAAGHDASLE